MGETMKKDFWSEFKVLDGRFGTGKMKLCKIHGFAASLKGWKYCPFCGKEMCE